MQKNKRINPYKFILIIIVLTFFVFMFSGITLSYISTNKNTKQISAIVFNEGDLAINYLDGNKVKIEKPFNKSYEYKFSVTNTGSSKVYYAIYLTNVQVYEKNIKVRLLNDKKELISKENLTNGENLLQSVIIIEPGNTDRYSIIVDNKNNKTNINGLISIKNESEQNKTLQDLILSDNIINIKSKTNTNAISKENEGLIKGLDDYGTSYYFRGKVENNYLKIADKLFRIVRINGDGTIRIILDDAISSNKEFNTVNEEEPNKAVLLENSTISSTLNDWYENNLKEYDEFFIGSSFCSDSNFNTIIKDIKYSDTYNRITKNDPTFRCFSESYLSKIGLLTPDEILYAGGSTKGDNTSYYLYNEEIEEETWSMGSYSLSNRDIQLFTLSAKGKLVTNSISKKLYIRPVLNIKINVSAQGEGTLDNPYILVK